MRKIEKCAIIGMGLLGTAHADELNGYHGINVTAVCDLYPEKAKDWAEKNNASWYDDFKLMLSKENPDLVVITTQDPYHTEPLLACCEAKVPFVLCEKPLTTSVEDAIAVKDAAQKSGTQIKVIFPNRLFPLGQSIHLLISEGYLGEPKYGEMRIDDNISVPLNLWGKNSKNFSEISSPAYFLFSHTVDLLYYYLAPRRVKKVFAVSSTGIIGSRPDYLDGYLTWDDGTITRIKTEWTKRIDTLVENYCQMTCTKGGFTFNMTTGFKKEEGLQIFIDGPKENAENAQKRLKHFGITAELKSFTDPIESYALEFSPDVDGNDFNWGDGSRVYADSFMGKDSQLSILTDLDGGIAQVRVVDALLRSAREEKIIEL